MTATQNDTGRRPKKSHYGDVHLVGAVQSAAAAGASTEPLLEAGPVLE